jgi:hypothetical protein
MRSIVLIDDKQDVVDELAAELAKRLPPGEVEIRKWVPSQAELDPRKAFEAKLDGDTTLVVTDSDLTQGQTGLFGASVVAWCQQRAIPVGDYSRKLEQLPKEPDLFELRVPTEPVAAAAYVAGVFAGFRSIKEGLATNASLLTKRSSAAVLAHLLGQPEVENQFALYAVRLGSASGALMDRVSATASEKDVPSSDDKRDLLAYIAGHLLLNILRFPGPILSMRALKAYVASDEADAADVVDVFTSARYSGPFAGLDHYFWLSRVDEVIAGLMDAVPAAEDTYETAGEGYRAALEKKLGRVLRRHECSRCGGKNGGFYCPFTTRTVCTRTDCSVGSNSWLPQGAKLCRIERGFFDEWAPILGL